MDQLYLYRAKPKKLRNSSKRVVKKPQKDEHLWIDIENKNEFNKIKDVFGIHPVTVDDCLKSNAPIKIEVFEDYVLIIAYNIIVEKNELKKEEIDFVLGKNFLITAHVNNEAKIIRELQKDKETIQDLLQKGADYVAHYILDRMMESYFPALETIEEESDKTEVMLFKKTETHNLSKLFRLKQQIMEIRRYTTNHREVIGVVTKRSMPFISSHAIIYFRDVYDKVIRVSDFVEIQREIVSDIVETYTIMVGNRMNEIIKVLTIITTLAMPVTVIGTWYGMNFVGMPELASPWGYIGATSTMIIFTCMMLWYFKRKGWF